MLDFKHLSDISSGVLYDITVEVPWMQFLASKGEITWQDVVEHAKRQERRILLLQRELDTLSAVDFTNTHLHDLDNL